MTRDERLAAGERILRAIFAVPESEMDVVNARPIAITDEVAGYLWSAARDAYLKQEGEKP